MNTEEILKNADNISLTDAANSSKLCAIWPEVKAGLQLLINVIKNPIVKLSIDAIIAAGDAITAKICG